MKWVNLDPECGAYVERDQKFAAKFARKFPEHYMAIPNWLSWLLQLTTWMNRRAQSLVYDRKPEAQSGEKK